MSGVCPASTPPRQAAFTVDFLVSPMTRRSSTKSIRSDPFGGIASTTVEQDSTQLSASLQRQLTRDR